MKTCPKCGYETENDNAKFCHKCGERMPEQVQESIPGPEIAPSSEIPTYQEPEPVSVPNPNPTPYPFIPSQTNNNENKGVTWTLVGVIVIELLIVVGLLIMLVTSGF